MSVEKLNDAAILEQLDGYWEKMTAFLLHKLAKRGEQVVITLDDMKALERDWPDGAVIFCHGRSDSIGLQLVSREDAERLATHDRTMRGNA